jgi:hypothetical protein
MPSYKDKFIVPACKNLVRHAIIRESLREQFGETTDIILGHLRRGEPLPEHLEEAYDTIIECVMNDAPVVDSFSFENRGDPGLGRTLSVNIVGFPGGYFVHGGEFGVSEIFPSLKAAKRHAETYGD